MALSIRLALALFVFPCLVFGFEFPNPFGLRRVKPTVVEKRPSTPLLELQKRALVEAVSFTSNGKTATPEQQSRVLEIVRNLETSFPPSPLLLSDLSEAAILDGVWYLQYTSPSVVGDPDKFPDAWKPENAKEGESNIETTNFQAKGTVAATVITVETANRVVQQNIGVNDSRVTNDIELEWGKIIAAGSYRQSPIVPNRALVSFDTFKIQLNNGFGLDFGFLFPLVRTLSGSQENGWLETTFVDKDIRIGRGNKGTMFVLTRELDAVKP